MSMPGPENALDHVGVVIFGTPSFDNLFGAAVRAGEGASFESVTGRTRSRSGRVPRRERLPRQAPTTTVCEKTTLAAAHANGVRRGEHVKSQLAGGLLLGCLMAAAGCSSSSSSTASPATTAASPATTTASPTPKVTARNFQVSTPSGQVSLSLDGQLPPNWPSQFPVPAGAKAAGSGSLGGSSSATLVAVYATSQSGSDAFAFYRDNSKLTTSDQRSAGSGAHYVGRAKITAPYTGSVTVVSHSGTTYIVIVLTNAPRPSSPSATAS